MWPLVVLLLQTAPTPAPAAPPEARCLLEAYPDHLCSATATDLVWCDGTKMPWKVRPRPLEPLEARLDEADLTDQLAQRYPVGRDHPVPPPVDFDPGRARYEPFFRKMYGDSKKAVAGHLAEVRWLPDTANVALKVTTVNSVHRKLEAVSADLAKLPADLREFAAKPAGTFVWRSIKGSGRLSMHSFAIAIDVGVGFADYWKWVRPDADGKYAYRNRFPYEVVEAFERQGFVWGGKWYHFDTMHFEYRPEMFAAPCAPKPAGEVTE